MLLFELEPGVSYGSCIRMTICNNLSWLNPFPCLSRLLMAIVVKSGLLQTIAGLGVGLLLPVACCD
jgi:Na+/H+ antiporter NhaA